MPHVVIFCMILIFNCVDTIYLQFFSVFKQRDIFLFGVIVSEIVMRYGNYPLSI